MKVVHGSISQYQLVEKTKRKDIDGTAYLVAGESSLWVKLLKDRSSSKQVEIRQLISQGKSTGFEKPLEIVTDHRGFAGFTFEGETMDVVPPEPTHKEKLKEKKRNNDKGEPFGKTADPPVFHEDVQNRKERSGNFHGLILILAAIVLGGCTIFFLNEWIVNYIYFVLSEEAGKGCAVLSMHGVLPMILGILGQGLFHKWFGGRTASDGAYLAVTISGYVIGLLAAYLILSAIGMLVISVFGFVATYQSTIIGVISLVITAVIVIRMFRN